MKKIIFTVLFVCAFAMGGCILSDKPDAPGTGTKGGTTITSAVKDISFVVYRPAADGSEKLLPEKITMAANGKGIPENALNVLLSDKPKDPKLISNVPEGTRLLGLKISDGVATADFSREIAKRGQGSYDELMLVYSIVNTLTEFKEIKKVQFLVEGQRVITFSGHMDLEDPLKRNETLLK